MKNKTVKRINCEGRELIVTLFDNNLKEIEDLGWYWESLLYANRNCILAKVEEVGSPNILELSVKGNVEVLYNNGEPVKYKDIKKMVINKEIYELNMMDLNWFGLQIKNKDWENSEIDEVWKFDIIDSEPKSKDELANVLVDYYLKTFDNSFEI